MSIELEQLKKVVLEGGYDEESKQEVLQLEQELQELASAENIAALPAILKFVSYMNNQKEMAELLLRRDRALSDTDRIRLFERIDLCDHFTSLFTGAKRAIVEDRIKDLLNVASTN